MRGVGLAIAKTASGNAKLGDCATTHAAQASCPSSCVFKDGGGCYAESGRQGMFVTRRVNEVAELLNADALDVAMAEADAIDAMEVVPGRPMRLHTVGDCPTDDCARVVAAAAKRYIERGGGPVWTYTHAWRDVDRASWGRVSVLASCETAADVEEARARGYATALVVEEFESDRKYLLGTNLNSVDGLNASAIRNADIRGDIHAVLPCPSMTRNVACSDCRLCFNEAGIRDRGYSIGFEIHGIPYAQRAARLALQRPDDPLRRIPSEERIRIVRDRYLRIEGREPTVREVAEVVDLNHASVGEWLRYLRGEIVHPAERRRRARELKLVAGGDA